MVNSRFRRVLAPSVLVLSVVGVALSLAGCSSTYKPQKPPLYDPGKETQEKAIAAQHDATYRKLMHDRHMPGY